MSWFSITEKRAGNEWVRVGVAKSKNVKHFFQFVCSLFYNWNRLLRQRPSPRIENYKCWHSKCPTPDNPNTLWKRWHFCQSKQSVSNMKAYVDKLLHVMVKRCVRGHLQLQLEGCCQCCLYCGSNLHHQCAVLCVPPVDICGHSSLNQPAHFFA